MSHASVSATALLVLVFAPPAVSGASASADELSFRAPIDFATGATPSSAEFNRASGDQVGLLFTRTPLSASVAVGDLDEDGRADVVQTNPVAGTVSVLLSDGGTGFTPAVEHPVGREPVHVVVGLIDNDGHLDLATANVGSSDVAVFYGDGDGGFARTVRLPVPTPRNVAIGAFDADDLPDLAVTSSRPALVTPGTPPRPTEGGVTVFTGTATGAFVPSQYLPTTAAGEPVNANFVAVGDFDADGHDDLAVGVGIDTSAGDPQADDAALTGDDVLVFMGGRGAAPGAAFALEPQQRIRVGAWPVGIVVAQLDPDSTLDLAVLGAASGDITTLLGAGDGEFRVAARNVTVGAIPRALAAADFDDDGALDLATANFTSSTVSVLAGRGDGRFLPATEFWSGDATTGVAVGDFSGDGVDDVVAGRLRDDHLALLVNDSPQKGDGVRIERDIAFGRSDDPLAAHRTLDVFAPPKGTPSFAGDGRAYPVLFFAHGGGGISGDKSMVGYLMRSLAREGLVAVSANYRLGNGLAAAQAQDVADAFDWVRNHVASRRFGGDPGNMVIFGHSAGAGLVAVLATDKRYAVQQQHVRGLLVAGLGPGNAPGSSVPLPPALLVNGDEGVEPVMGASSADFAAAYRNRGGSAKHVFVAGRDHMTILSDLAVDADPGRAHVLGFLREHMRADRSSRPSPTTPASLTGTLPASGRSDGWPVMGALMLGLGVVVRGSVRMTPPHSAALSQRGEL